jgi:hypothetical protein
VLAVGISRETEAANPAVDVVRKHLVGWIENKKGGDV